MSKNIINIVQLDQGGTNPKSELFEQPLWELHFEDEDKRILGKAKMEEYLSKGYNNTVYQFKRWTASTTSGTEVRLWAVVFTDNSHDLCVANKFYQMLKLGHQRKDEEKYKEIEEKLHLKRLPENTALFHPKSLTTKDERKELDEYRKKILDEARNEEENQDIVRGEY
jgi:hypothetical protein|tara:strand:- start:343 stop:846 length:504 start_codon:yes stop_codon:yes gene_type:complete